MFNDDDDYFKSADLALVATLVEHDYSPIKLDRSNSHRVAFVFADSEKLQSVIDDYWADGLTVNPRTYFDTLKHLKTRIYAR